MTKFYVVSNKSENKTIVQVCQKKKNRTKESNTKKFRSKIESFSCNHFKNRQEIL